MQPAEIQPGMTITEVNGYAVPPQPVARVVLGKNPLTGDRVWFIRRADGHTELALYEQDTVTV